MSQPLGGTLQVTVHRALATRVPAEQLPAEVSDVLDLVVATAGRAHPRDETS